MIEKLKLGGHDNHKVTGHMSKIYAIKKEEQKESTQLYFCKFSNDFGKYIFFGGSQVNSVKVFDWSGKGLASIDQLSHAPVALDSIRVFNFLMFKIIKLILYI